MDVKISSPYSSVVHSRKSIHSVREKQGISDREAEENEREGSDEYKDFPPEKGGLFAKIGTYIYKLIHKPIQFVEKRKYIFIPVILLLVMYYVFKVFIPAQEQMGINLEAEIRILQQKYPNQNKELWHNVLKIVNATEPKVHCFILLYKDTGAVAECFAKDFLRLINKLNGKGEKIYIYKENDKVTDYGEELEHYLKLVRISKHLVVLKVHEMPGTIARIFHVLCDEVLESIRPSYFIFTLEDKNSSTYYGLRPLLKASHILRNAWNNLMENELHPLISRVVRNAAEMLPESVTC